MILLYRGGIYKQLWTLELRPELSVSALWSSTQEEFLGKLILLLFMIIYCYLLSSRLQFDEFQIVSSSHDDTILIWDFLNCTPTDG